LLAKHSEGMDEPHHDEINLIRLLRRLEKSVSNKEEWQPSSRPQPEIWLKTQNALQKLKFARKLVKNVEFDNIDQSPKRIKQLNDTKIRLDRIEVFLKDCEKQSKPEVVKPISILPTLPIPELPSEPTPPAYSEIDKSHESQSKTMAKRSPRVSTAGLFISPPDPSDFSPTLITSAIPSLLPVNAADTSLTSAYARSAAPTARKLGVGNSIAVQEELSSQLELMAAQLKRNAIHFSTSLAKDQAVVEDAQQKLEGNYDVMMKERVRLRDHRGKSGSTTCMVLAIVALVFILFILMISIIRFS